jgi:acetoin utilization protein AcuB
MSKAEPTIQKFMTTQPYFIEASEKLETAVKIMSDRQIRHLPVTRQGEVVGILSDRDVKLAMGIEGLDLSRLPVLVGIFTTVDACRALAEIVATRYHV